MNPEPNQPTADVWTHCAICDRAFRNAPAGEYTSEFLCHSCERTVPASLVKALSDPFDYALQLRTGVIVRFQFASIDGEFVDLSWHENSTDVCEVFYIGGRGRHKLKWGCSRGIQVRLSDIVWCTDAPHGS